MTLHRGSLVSCILARARGKCEEAERDASHIGATLSRGSEATISADPTALASLDQNDDVQNRLVHFLAAVCPGKMPGV